MMETAKGTVCDNQRRKGERKKRRGGRQVWDRISTVRLMRKSRFWDCFFQILWQVAIPWNQSAVTWLYNMHSLAASQPEQFAFTKISQTMPARSWCRDVLSALYPRHWLWKGNHNHTTAKAFSSDFEFHYLCNKQNRTNTLKLIKRSEIIMFCHFSVCSFLKDVLVTGGGGACQRLRRYMPF